MRQILHSVLSVLLAVLLVFGSAPKEYIHLFAHHEDTVHTPHDDGEAHFDTEHHHCSFLDLSLPSFLNNIATVFVPCAKEVYVKHNVSITERMLAYSVSKLYLRGPPAYNC